MEGISDETNGEEESEERQTALQYHRDIIFWRTLKGTG